MVLWRTIDARYGADTVLYARPLQEPECGYDVSNPVAVFRAETINERLLGATTDDALWVTIPQIGGGATADLYQFQRCAE